MLRGKDNAGVKCIGGRGQSDEMGIYEEEQAFMSLNKKAENSDIFFVRHFFEGSSKDDTESPLLGPWCRHKDGSDSLVKDVLKALLSKRRALEVLDSTNFLCHLSTLNK